MVYRAVLEIGAAAAEHHRHRIGLCQEIDSGTVGRHGRLGPLDYIVWDRCTVDIWIANRRISPTLRFVLPQ